MIRWLIIAEGESAGLFDPLDQLRPTYQLRNGAWSVAERWVEMLMPSVVIAGVRPALAEAVIERSRWLINRVPGGEPEDVWIIVGTASPRNDTRWDGLAFPTSFICTKGTDVVARLDGKAWKAHRQQLSAWITDSGTGPVPLPSEIPNHPDAPILSASGLWDLVNHLPEQLQFDRDLWMRTNGPGENPKAHCHDSAVLLSPQNIWIGHDVQIGPHTVIDATAGPVILDTGVVLEPFTRLDGPAFVGAYSRLVGGKITGGCVFGPGCRIGGEVEASIVQGFSNKVHEGFFGHGFIGEWVNLGALTTNSDLKNNYGSVRVERNGKTIDTGCLKVGSYLSDHTKTAIGTLLPTGSATGVGVNLLSGGLAPKSVPPFVWGGGGRFTEHRIDRMLDTARAAIVRRGVMLKMAGRADQLSGGEEEALRMLFANSMEARAAFLHDHETHSNDPS